MRFHLDTSKSTAAVCNFVILVCAITAMAFGIAEKIDIDPVDFLIPEEHHEIVLLPVLTIIISLASIFTSVFGWICIFLERPQLAVMFAISYGILILMAFTASIPFRFMIDHPKTLEYQFFEVLGEYTPFYETDTTSAAKNKVDWIHRTLRCCGRYNVQPYSPTYPESCIDPETKLNYTRTCQDAMTKKMILSTKKLTGVLWALIVTEIFGLLAATYLIHVLYAEYD